MSATKIRRIGYGLFVFDAIVVVTALTGLEHRPDCRLGIFERRRSRLDRGGGRIGKFLQRRVETVAIFPDRRRGRGTHSRLAALRE